MFQGGNYGMDHESQFAAAIAASAYAIYSIDQITTKANPSRRKQADIFITRPTQQQASAGGSMRKKSGEETRRTSFADQHRENLRIIGDSTDAWEQAQLAKIRKRYEKLRSEIVAWENEKKVKEKHRMERRKSELEVRKSRNLKHYRSKIARIDHIADGARAQVDEKRKQQESIVKEKARKFRSTGKVPLINYCFCL